MFVYNVQLAISVPVENMCSAHHIQLFFYQFPAQVAPGSMKLERIGRNPCIIANQRNFNRP